MEMIIDYDHLGRIQHHLKEKNIEIVSVDYTDKVKVTIYLESDQVGKISGEIMNLTSGNVKISMDQEELFYKDGDRLLKLI